MWRKNIYKTKGGEGECKRRNMCSHASLFNKESAHTET
jgi:hypothetical protein